MSDLRKDALKSPKYYIAIIVLLAIGIIALPVDLIFSLFISDTLKAKLIGGIVVRFALAIVAVLLIKKLKFNKVFKSINGYKSLFMVIPALLVAVNNFPFVAVFSGQFRLKGDTLEIILYIVYCLSVGAFEELLYAGVVFPLCLYIFKEKRFCIIYGAIVSASVFSLSHLINLFGGAGVGATLLQVGYSFLIGAMCVVCVCTTGNIITAIILHGVYDIGGLFFSLNYGIAVGNQWDTLTVVITAILGVIVAIYVCIIAFKLKPDQIKRVYIFD